MNHPVTVKDKKIQRLIDTLQLFPKEQFSQLFSLDENCLAFLFEFLYPGNTKCPCCGNEFRYVLLRGEMVYQCLVCNCIVDPKAETPFKDSLLTLSMWFRELYSLKEYPFMQKVELIRIVNLAAEESE